MWTILLFWWLKPWVLENCQRNFLFNVNQLIMITILKCFFFLLDGRIWIFEQKLGSIITVINFLKLLLSWFLEFWVSENPVYDAKFYLHHATDNVWRNLDCYGLYAYILLFINELPAEDLHLSIDFGKCGCFGITLYEWTVGWISLFFLYQSKLNLSWSQQYLHLVYVCFNFLQA